MKIKIAICAIVTAALTIQPAFAWNAHGHRVIASIAFLRLDPARRLEIANRIRKHPRWEQDFAGRMPDEVLEGGEQIQAEWVFQKAAAWPDTTRSLRGDEGRKYNHPTWHYIDKITYLNESDKEAIGPILMNLSTTPPDEQTEDMNAVQAIEFAKLHVNGTVKVSPEQDALMLCWLLHVYSDLHQPCHSTEIFAKKVLPEGCNGANLIKTKQSRNLHALWDGLLGNDNEFRACHNQAAKLMADNQLNEGLKGRLNEAWLLDAKQVWDDSHACAKSFVYADEVRAHLQRLEAAGETKVAPIELTEKYLKIAGRVAQYQANNAGWRLSKVLNQNNAD